MKKDRLINFGGHSGGGALGECPGAGSKRAYESPEVTVVTFKMERGFQASLQGNTTTAFDSDSWAMGSAGTSAFNSDSWTAGSAGTTSFGEQTGW